MGNQCIHLVPVLGNCFRELFGKFQTRKVGERALCCSAGLLRASRTKFITDLNLRVSHEPSARYNQQPLCLHASLGVAGRHLGSTPHFLAITPTLGEFINNSNNSEIMMIVFSTNTHIISCTREAILEAVVILQVEGSKAQRSSVSAPR